MVLSSVVRRTRRIGRGVPAAVAATAVVAAGLALVATPSAADGRRGESRNAVVGSVRSGGKALAGYRVTVHASFWPGSRWVRLGSDVTDRHGRFRIDRRLPGRTAGRPVLLVEATRGGSDLVTAVAARPSAPVTRVVVNERTTVAAGTALAQFVRDVGDGTTGLGAPLDGSGVGVRNAVRMAANLADPHTGRVAEALRRTPNGGETSTLATFNSLTNAVTACIATRTGCRRLLRATTPPDGPVPHSVFQAVANVAKHPSYTRDRGRSGDPLFRLAREHPVNRPALSRRPTSWLLFLKITGGFYSAQDSDNLMNGPGNFAIDEDGFVWVNDNAVPRPPGRFACAGRRLLRFTPWGAPVPRTPYFGGGLSGAGYGITLDPAGRVWVSNFGFQDPPCALLPRAARHDSVSVFSPDGRPLSPPRGFRRGDISWPQGTVSDRDGNVWMANCGNDSVTLLRGGNPYRAVNIPLGPPPEENRPQMKPFGLTVDADGNVWAAGNRSDTLSVISPDGEVVDTIPGRYRGRTVLSHPVGNATDTHGNVWVANSDWLDSPCPTRTQLGDAEDPSISVFSEDSHRPHPRAPFTGGGLTLPWGIAVDGDDTIWVFNFGAVPVGTDTDTPTGISRFCGVDTDACPGDLQTGDPISPSTGYRSDALERITGGQIDPSGNVWLTNNWKIDANPFVNPFGNAIVVAIGAAGPLETPLIGPPVPAR